MKWAVSVYCGTHVTHKSKKICSKLTAVTVAYSNTGWMNDFWLQVFNMADFESAWIVFPCGTVGHKDNNLITLCRDPDVHSLMTQLEICHLSASQRWEIKMTAVTVPLFKTHAHVVLNREKKWKFKIWKCVLSKNIRQKGFVLIEEFWMKYKTRS